MRTAISANGMPATTKPTAANCEAPANVITLIAWASMSEYPALRAASPKTKPNPATETPMAAVSSHSWRRAARRSTYLRKDFPQVPSQTVTTACFSVA